MSERDQDQRQRHRPLRDDHPQGRDAGRRPGHGPRRHRRVRHPHRPPGADRPLTCPVASVRRGSGHDRPRVRSRARSPRQPAQTQLRSPPCRSGVARIAGPRRRRAPAAGCVGDPPPPARRAAISGAGSRAASGCAASTPRRTALDGTEIRACWVRRRGRCTRTRASSSSPCGSSRSRASRTPSAARPGPSSPSTSWWARTVAAPTEAGRRPASRPHAPRPSARRRPAPSRPRRPAAERMVALGRPRGLRSRRRSASRLRSRLRAGGQVTSPGPRRRGRSGPGTAAFWPGSGLVLVTTQSDGIGSVPGGSVVTSPTVKPCESMAVVAASSVVQHGSRRRSPDRGSAWASAAGWARAWASAAASARAVGAGSAWAWASAWASARGPWTAR